MIRVRIRTLVVLAFVCTVARAGDAIPRPEHPTPDAVRPHWMNLNGPWQFRFDPKNEGSAEGWMKPDAPGFDQTIVVPFGWESKLSGIHEHGKDTPKIGWYRRSFAVPADFPAGDRVWLRFGAVDYLASVWVNGSQVMAHEGGYTPFEADITDALRGDGPNTVVVFASDPTDPSVPTGKQVGWYTTTSGIWQTVWLESRPKVYIAGFRVTTRLPGTVFFNVRVKGLAEKGPLAVSVRSDDPTVPPASLTMAEAPASPADQPGAAGFQIKLDVRDPKLWSPESPHLYDVTLEAKGPDGEVDTVKTYFGIRTIARGKYGDEPFERILLNGKPLYLRSALDQSFNSEGVYTAPSDAFLKHDIELAKSFNLNGLRIHIKPDEPRRLYWADKLGMLILEDMPNTWMQNDRARASWENTMRGVVARDGNHPSIVAWIAFNETWGLTSGRSREGYKADRDTQAWVGRMVETIRSLDPTRLVEDQSPCNYDHIEDTDLNSWHFYIDQHDEAAKHIADVVAKTEPGSAFNYCPGLTQGTAPLINSEYAGISSGSGDRDISWSFRDLTTLLRKEPKIQGYVYTELDDIEWEHNGFVNYDRSPKVFGYDAFVEGMTVADLQGPDFIGYDGPPVVVAKPGEEVVVPLFVSHYSDRAETPSVRWTFQQVFPNGAVQWQRGKAVPVPDFTWAPYTVRPSGTIKVQAASEPAVGAVGFELVDRDGKRIAANFVNVVVKPEEPEARVERLRKDAAIVRFAPGDAARKEWSGDSGSPWGKVFGRGRGFFEYRITLPESVVRAKPRSITLRAELASSAGRGKVDWPERFNRQDYPQTDGRKWPSTVEVSVDGHPLGRIDLPDDPSDARGVYSHLAHRQPGSHGELVSIGGALPEAVRAGLAAGKPLVLRLAVPDDAAHAGGLTIFGAGTGAYPSDPTLTITTEGPLPDDL